MRTAMTSRTSPFSKRNALATLVLLGVIVMCNNARADIVVIVNAANKVEIDDSTLARIYLAQVKTFPGGGEVAAIEQKDGSPIREQFSEKLLKRAPAHIKAYWAQQKFTGNAKPLRQLNGDEAVIKFVSETPSAIGYVDSAKLHEGVKSVKVVVKL